MTVISMRFKFQEESHEIKFSTCQPWPDTIVLVFWIFGSGSETSDKMNDFGLTHFHHRLFNVSDQAHGSFFRIVI